MCYVSYCLSGFWKHSWGYSRVQPLYGDLLVHCCGRRTNIPSSALSEPRNASGTCWIFIFISFLSFLPFLVLGEIRSWRPRISPGGCLCAQEGRARGPGLQGSARERGKSLRFISRKTCFPSFTTGSGANRRPLTNESERVTSPRRRAGNKGALCGGPRPGAGQASLPGPRKPRGTSGNLGDREPPGPGSGRLPTSGASTGLRDATLPPTAIPPLPPAPHLPTPGR